jgi:hypothetical protein
MNTNCEDANEFGSVPTAVAESTEQPTNLSANRVKSEALRPEVRAALRDVAMFAAVQM